MDTTITGEEPTKIEKSHRGSLNKWVGGLEHITVQTCYNLKCLTMRLSGYIYAPTKPAFIALKNGMEYLMYHSHEPIMYSKKQNL